MFEKEAEEIANKRCNETMCFSHCNFSSSKHHRCGDWHREYECALKGAEFGYNKANEWNFVKDEKYPTHEQYVTVLYQNCDKLNTYTCLYDTHSKLWMYYNLDNMWLEKFDYKVLAWKEIVLPSLDKEKADDTD